MNFYSKELFLDQFTPVSIYEKVKSLYPNEITFLFESTINSNDGNYSYIIIGARERVWYENNTCYYKNEQGETQIVESNPLNFLKRYYKNFDKQIYKNKSEELGIGLIDGFIGNVGYDIGKEFEPKLKESMNDLIDQLNIPDLDLIRPNIILGFSHKTSKLVMITSVESKKEELDNIENILFSIYDYSPLKKSTILD
jgi:anthranilate synthase component 1